MVDPITVSLSVPSAPFKINSTVRLAATVMQGTSPAAGASVLFKVLKPNGSTASKIVTADSTGKAAWGYRVGPKDPNGTYQVIAIATYGSQTAPSSTGTFTVQ